jgi:geranylgeranyl diphosphate synthase type II
MIREIATRMDATPVGGAGATGGQFLDFEPPLLLTASFRDRYNEIERLYIDKTGRLMAAVCDLGAISVGARAPERQALHNYGLKLGLAYQIVDDLNDQISDAKKGHVNYTALVGRQRTERRVIGLLKKARGQSRKFAINTFLLDCGNTNQNLNQCVPIKMFRSDI